MITALYLWKIPTRSIPFAFLRMALDRRAIGKIEGVKFSKSLGCGKGEKFTISDADIRRWGLLICLDEANLESLDTASFVENWRQRSTREFRLLLDPISSHGKWSGAQPFDFRNDFEAASEEIVAITRARISLGKILEFWRSIPHVAISLHESPGVVAAIGIGESPVGLQGTFSIWRSAKDLQNFAFKGQAHIRAIESTAERQWYSEELFARFRIREKRGSL